MRTLNTITALATLLLAACGDGSATDECGDNVCGSSETAGSCAEDCGCGNGVANPGEECDGLDLGGGDCMSETGRGGTLGCTAQCTYDTDRCDIAGCGNGVLDAGELCDGSQFGERTCESVGFVGGSLVCTASCVLETSACCTDTCPTEGLGQCIGNTLRSCERNDAGCLAWQVTDCSAGNDLCEMSGNTASCVCVDRCETVGDQRCEGATIETCMESGGCRDWVATTNCGTTGQVCAEATSGPLCAVDAAAEDCSDPYPLTAGANVVAWTAATADYLVAQPSCNTSTLAGPDIVMSYTAPEDGFVRVTMDKASGARQVIAVSSAACGTLTPEVACAADTTPTEITAQMGVDAGTTYFFYVRDTSTGTATLANPLQIEVEESLCSTLVVQAGTLSPANATSLPDTTPLLTAEFPYPVDPTVGVITVTGDQGTNLSFDLAALPPAVSLVNNGQTLSIDPGIVFPAGENVTVAWTGLRDATCAKPITSPTWQFEVTGPACAPGVGGLVGTTITRIPTTVASTTEYFVGVDQSATGFVYVGGTSELTRTPKAGGTTQDVEAAAALTATQLGYDMVVVGNEVYTLESTTTAGVTSNLLWRITRDGGATWVRENYVVMPTEPTDDMRGLAHHEGRLYMVVDDTATNGTQIFSVAAGSAAFPVTGQLEGSVAEGSCNDIAVDDTYFYLTCATNDRVVRVARSGLAVELVTNSIDLSTTKNSIVVHDIDGDGVADALYLNNASEEVHYVCDPSAAGPFTSGLVTSFGGATGNYGMDFDPVAGALWLFDDDTEELVKIE